MPVSNRSLSQIRQAVALLGLTLLPGCMADAAPSFQTGPAFAPPAGPPPPVAQNWAPASPTMRYQDWTVAPPLRPASATADAAAPPPAVASNVAVRSTPTLRYQDWMVAPSLRPASAEAVAPPASLQASPAKAVWTPAAPARLPDENALPSPRREAPM